jgi:hypothetical protein
MSTALAISYTGLLPRIDIAWLLNLVGFPPKSKKLGSAPHKVYSSTWNYSNCIPKPQVLVNLRMQFFTVYLA